MLTENDILQNRYRIVSQLGYGGMGAVYKAIDKRLGTQVALKEIIIEKDRTSAVDKKEIFQRAFEREAKLLANLHHEIFPRVMDYFSEGDRRFLIMELVVGDDLSDILNQSATHFSIKSALQWADQLLDALDYLHTQNPPIYHRDIKPANIKITPRGKIKLLDFGIAKSVDQMASTFTNQTFVGATLNYAPIEQVLPALAPTFREFIILKHEKQATDVLAQNTDARCDIYAVGATFYHVLTDSIPIDSAKRVLEIWEGNKDPLPAPDKTNPALSPSISSWLLKAMEVDRDQRFSSAHEMRESLQKIIAVEKVQKSSAVMTASSFDSPNPVSAVQPTVSDEKQLMQKITEKLIDSEVPKPVSTSPSVLQTSPTPPVQSNLPLPDTIPSVDFQVQTDSMLFQTNDLPNPTETSPTESPYYDASLIKEKNPPRLSAVNRRNVQKKSRLPVSGILLGVVLILLTTGIVSVFLLKQANSPRDGEKADDLSVSEANSSVPSVSESNSITANVSVAESNSNGSVVSESPKNLSPIAANTVSTSLAENEDKKEQNNKPATVKNPVSPPVKPPPPRRTPTPRPQRVTRPVKRHPDTSHACVVHGNCDNSHACLVHGNCN